jgi:ABC-2 type transport system ATP-binding protein
MMNSAIAVADLRVTRGDVEVLHGVSFALASGSLTGLLGPSGSGKTTLMRALLGVQTGVVGRVELLSLPAGDASLRHRVGYVTQAPAVYADLTVTENLRYVAAVLGASTVRIGAVLGQVALEAHGEQPVRTLSGGERARVSLAVALLGSPEVLVLDEPTVGLDPVLRRDLWQLFRELAAAGAALLVSSHVMDEATRCDRLLLLRDGRVVADDSLPGLLASTGAADAEGAFLAIAEGAAA